jgi:hypothetical protein
MSGSIGRSYLIQSWNDASSYSGEQIGQRLKQSTDLYLANGKANTGLFADEVPKKARPKQKHIRNKICPQNTTLDNLDKQEKELDEAYLAGDDIDDQEYLELSRALEAKRLRAHKSLMRSLGLPNDYYALQPSLNDDEDEAIGQPSSTGQRPLYAFFSLLKGAFVRSIKAVRSGDYRKVWEGVKTITKNHTTIFLTRCIGLAIILLVVSKF